MRRDHGDGVPVAEHRLALDCWDGADCSHPRKTNGKSLVFGLVFQSRNYFPGLNQIAACRAMPVLKVERDFGFRSRGHQAVAAATASDFGVALLPGLASAASMASMCAK